MNIEFDFLPDNPEGIYLVGGIVRDLLAGHPRQTSIWSVAGDIGRVAGQIAAKNRRQGHRPGEKGICRPQGRIAADTTIDITPLAHPSIEADLLQRDFTINAMAYDVKARRLVDCTGGRADMQRKAGRSHGFAGGL
jgi:poly(A) polymerase